MLSDVKNEEIGGTEADRSRLSLAWQYHSSLDHGQKSLARQALCLKMLIIVFTVLTVMFSVIFMQRGEFEAMAYRNDTLFPDPWINSLFVHSVETVQDAHFDRDDFARMPIMLSVCYYGTIITPLCAAAVLSILGSMEPEMQREALASAMFTIERHVYL